MLEVSYGIRKQGEVSSIAWMIQVLGLLALDDWLISGGDGGGDGAIKTTAAAAAACLCFSNHASVNILRKRCYLLGTP